MCADVRDALPIINTMLEDEPIDPSQFAEWRANLEDRRSGFPMRYPKRDDVIIPQWAIEVSSPVRMSVHVRYHSTSWHEHDRS